MTQSPARGSLRIAGAAALALALFSSLVGPAQGADSDRSPVTPSTSLTPRTVLPASALALIRTIPLGANGLAVAAGGQRTATIADDTIYVTSNNATVSAIDPVSLTKVASVSVGTYPIGVTVHPDDTVYVVNANSNTMTVIKGSTLAVGDPIPVPQEPQVVAVSRVSDDTLYISSRGGTPRITSLSARTLSGQVSTALGSNATPFGLGLTHDDTAFIGIWPQQPRLFDSTSQQVTTLTGLGSNLIGVAVSSDDTVYMTNESSSVVTSFKATTPGTTASVAVGTRPQGIAIGYDGTIFVASQNANRVSAINPLTNQVDDSVAVGFGPFGIAVTRTGVVVSANNSGSSASIVAAVTPTLTTLSAFSGETASLTIGGLPAGVLVDDTTVRTISFGDDTVPWTRSPGTNTFNWLIPSGSGSEDVVVSLNGGNRAYAGTFTYAVAPPPPPTPSSVPRDVVASGADGSASVSWSAPASSGSFPVSHYLATSSPGGRTCLATAPALACDVVGLTNGTAYTFTVKALTGAGWSESSAPSNAVIPTRRARASILISGMREGNRLAVTGRATGMDPATMVSPFVARSTGDFEAGASVAIGVDGSLAWSRRASRAVVWRVYMTTGDVRSNTVTIR